jgi:membrane protein
VATAITGVLGKDAALQIQDMIVKASLVKNSLLAAVIGIGTLLFGATGVFMELQKSLNFIWQVKPKEGQGFLKMLRDRLFSFGLIVSIGFLLTISLVITSLLTYFSGWISARFSLVANVLMHGMNFLLSFSIITVLFAMMFKILPDYKTRWVLIWPGSVLTSCLFLVGKFGLGYYFGKFQPASIYGAAGSVVLVLLWVSYSCMILFFGAEFTKQFSFLSEGRRSSETVTPPEIKPKNG